MDVVEVFFLAKALRFFVFLMMGGVCCNVYLNMSNRNVFLANVATSFSQMTFVSGSISSVGMSTVEDIIENHKNISDSSEQSGMFVSKVYHPGNSHVLFPRHF